MIPQAIMDLFRDLVVTIIIGISLPFGDINAIDAGAGLGSATALAGRLLALFIDPGMWGVILGSFGAFLTVFGVTGIIAIFARRGTAS